MQYSPAILDHFQSPRNQGKLEKPTHSSQVTNPCCMDRVELFLLVTEDTVQETRFLAEGCVPTIALVSILCEWLQGKSLSEAATLTAPKLEAMAGGLPRTKKHAAELAMEALTTALTPR